MLRRQHQPQAETDPKGRVGLTAPSDDAEASVEADRAAETRQWKGILERQASGQHLHASIFAAVPSFPYFSHSGLHIIA